jgi:hypothetical protein
MTPDQQRIAIATACGWTEIDGLSVKGLMGKPPGKICSFAYIPNYLNDLNAMHEAEKVLTKDQLIEQAEWIGACSNEMPNKAWVILLRATAAQRAEAFLRTLGLWQESPTQPQ